MMTWHHVCDMILWVITFPIRMRWQCIENKAQKVVKVCLQFFISSTDLLSIWRIFDIFDKINALVSKFFKNQTRLKCCPFTFSHTIWHFELQHGGAEKAKMLCVLLCLRWSELLFGKPVPILAWQLLDAVALTHARSHSLDFSTLLHDDVKAV